jgi:hypothetical protein
MRRKRDVHIMEAIAHALFGVVEPNGVALRERVRTWQRGPTASRKEG